MYYGNPKAIDTRNPGQVWDNKYVGVWHLQNTPAVNGTYSDASTKGNNGTYTNNFSPVNPGTDGLFGNGQSFSGTAGIYNADYVALPKRDGFPVGSSQRTMSGWFKLNNTSVYANGAAIFGYHQEGTCYARSELAIAVLGQASPYVAVRVSCHAWGFCLPAI